MTWRRRLTRGPLDVTMTVARIDDVFAAPTVAGIEVPSGLPSRIEEVVEDLLTQPADRRVHLTVELSEQNASATARTTLETALREYCEIRIRQAKRAAASTWRHGIESLPIGVVVLVVGLVGSELLRRTDLPEYVRVFFGDGVFVLVAWVALWYPLDQLVYYWRPHRREQRALEMLRDAPLVVVQAAPRADEVSG